MSTKGCSAKKAENNPKTSRHHFIDNYSYIKVLRKKSLPFIPLCDERDDPEIINQSKIQHSTLVCLSATIQKINSDLTISLHESVETSQRA